VRKIVERPEIERMVTLETQLGNIERMLLKLDDKFDNMTTVFVPRMEINEMFRQRDAAIATLQQEIISIKSEKQQNKTNAPTWVAAVIAFFALIVTLFQVF
jgi:hypothetical protein